MSCIQRLKKAWSCLPPKYEQSLKSIGDFISAIGNFKEYRTRIEWVQPPCIPLQEVVLRDLFFIDENPNTLENNAQVNFEKMSLLGKVFEQIKRFQKIPYGYKEDPVIQYYIDKAIILQEADLFIGSKTAEPPNPDPQSIKNAKMKEITQGKQLDKRAKEIDIAAEKRRKKEEKDRKEKKKEQEALMKKNKGKKTEVASSPPSSSSPMKEKRLLDEVLTDRRLFLDFERYLTVKHAEENLEFYETVMNTYKKLNFDDPGPENQKKIKETSQRIYEKFVKDGGDKQVNIGDDVKETIQVVAQTSEVPKKDFYDNSLNEVKFNLTIIFHTFIKDYAI